MTKHTLRKPLIEEISPEDIGNIPLKKFVERLKASDECGAGFHYHRDGHGDYNAHPDIDDDYTCD
ncbi:MAG: hypothetical protein ABIB79_01700 [archaeon]